MARSDLLWLDSDVILDWLADRKPWDSAASEIIERSICGEWALCFSPLTLANVHYIYRKHSGTADSLNAIATLAKIGRVATMDSGHVTQALSTGRSDFEDELQIASASSLPELTAIITRNLADYSHGSVPANRCRSGRQRSSDALPQMPKRLRPTPIPRSGWRPLVPSATRRSMLRPVRFPSRWNPSTRHPE